MHDENISQAARTARVPRRSTPATPARFPDPGRLAHRHLAAPLAAGDLDRLLRIVADWAAAERSSANRFSRLPPSKQKRVLDAAAADATSLATRMREFGPRPLLGTAAADNPLASDLVAPLGMQRPLATPLLDRAIAVGELTDGIGRLAAAYAAESTRVPAGKKGGAPQPEPLMFGLRALLEIWRRHRPGVPPDQGKSAGRFGALAGDLFCGPPCRFGVEEVAYAVAKLLPRNAAARQMQPVPEAERREARLAEVRIIGTKTGLAKALREALEHHGAKVRLDAWTNTPLRGSATAGGDLLIIVPDAEPVLALRNTATSPAMTEDAVMRSLVFDPLRELDRLDGHAKPKRVAIIMPALPDAPQFVVQAWASLYAARAALVSLLQLRARRPGWEHTTVIAIQVGWGANTSDAGLPFIPSGHDQIAAALVETLGSISPERARCAVDLYGSLLPVLQAWPQRDVERRAAEQHPVR